MADKGEKVQLYVYDLTMGMARQLSPMLLGKQIEGVWHTGVVVGGVEHFYGYGLQRAAAGRTPFGTPYQVVDLGFTQVPSELRDEMLQDLAHTFTPQAYNLLFHNCNHFSHEFSSLLTGDGIPEHILAQAQEVLNTPMGEMLMPMLMQMEVGLGHVTAGGAAPPAPNPWHSSATPDPNTTTSIPVTSTPQPAGTTTSIPVTATPQPAGTTTSIPVTATPQPPAHHQPARSSPQAAPSATNASTTADERGAGMQSSPAPASNSSSSQAHKETAPLVDRPVEDTAATGSTGSTQGASTGVSVNPSEEQRDATTCTPVAEMQSLAVGDKVASPAAGGGGV